MPSHLCGTPRMSTLPERTLGRSDSDGQMRSFGAPSNCVWYIYFAAPNIKKKKTHTHTRADTRTYTNVEQAGFVVWCGAVWCGMALGQGGGVLMSCMAVVV